MTRILLFLLFIPAAWAADTKTDAQSTSRNVLEIYLDRASGAKTEQDWKTAADWGLQAARAAWEKGAAAWNEDAGTLAADRQALTDALSADVTNAWQTWLVNRFYQSVGSMDTLTLAQSAAQADRQWLYQTDAYGKIVYDAAGNPVVLTKSGSGDDANDSAWKAAVTGSKQALLGSWDQTVQAALPELLSLPGASQGQMGDLALRIGAAYRDRYKRELDAMYLQQVSRYASTRLYDQFSLKKKSADDTAGTIVDQLIRDVKTGTDTGIQAVKASLALDGASVTAGSEVNAAQWQTSFRQVLDSGLAKWDVAEKQLLAQRADWETGVGASYQSGEAAWAAAYGKLIQERTAWQKQLQQILAAGQAQWDGKQAELSQSIANASAQLDQQMAQRQASQEQQVSALVDVYAQAQNLVQTAQTSGEYWFNRMVDPRNLGTTKIYSWTDMNSWASRRIDKMTGALQSQLNAAVLDIGTLTAAIGNAKTYMAPSVLPLSTYHVPYPSDANGLVRYATKTVTETVGVQAGWEQRTYTVILDWNFVWTGTGGQTVVTKSWIELSNKLSEIKAKQASLTNKIASLVPIKAALTTNTMTTANQTTLKAVEKYLNKDDIEKQNSWDSYNEAAYWLLKRVTYQTRADDAKGQLSAGLAAVMGSGGNPQDVLGSSDLEEGYLDEYQVALLKAQVQQQYWDREYQIAQQVYAYATDTSSSRPTEAQQQETWNQALAEYQAKKNAYADAVAALTADGQTVAGRQTSVDSAQDELDDARSELQAAQNAYSVAISARASNGNSSFYDQQIGSYEQDLEKLYGLTNSTEDTLATRLAAYRTALRDYGYAQELVGVQSQLASMVQGTAASGLGASTPSLADLQAAVAALLDPTLAVATPGAVPVIDGQYGAAAAAVQNVWQTATGADKDLAAAQYEAYYRAYAEGVRTTLAQRQAQIGLLVSGSAEEWYLAQTGQASSGAAASLKTSSASAEGRLLKARLSLASDAWTALATGDSAITAEGKTFAALIASQQHPGISEAAAKQAALGQLLAAGDTGNWWSDPAAHRSAIAVEVAKLSDPAVRTWLKAYLEGRSGIAMSSSDSTNDASQILVAQAREAFDTAWLLATLYDRGYNSSVSGIASGEERALATWNAYLLQEKWLRGGSVDAIAVAASVDAWAGSGSLEKSVSAAVAKLQSLSSGLRSDLREAAGTLTESLLNLAALKAQGPGLSFDIGEAQARAHEARATAETLNTLLGQTWGGASSNTAALKRASDLAAWARAEGSELGSELDGTLAAMIAPAIVQKRLGTTSSDPWSDALAEAVAGLDVPSAVRSAALAQAKSLYASMTEDLDALTAIAADPTSTLLGTVVIDASHLPLARDLWGWFSSDFPDRMSVWQNSLDPETASLTGSLAAMWNATNTAGRAGLVSVFDGVGAHLEAGRAAWSWFQTDLGGALLSSNHDGYLSQRERIDAYVDAIDDVSERAWAAQMFSSLQIETDQSGTGLSTVLADVFSSSPHARLNEAWVLLTSDPASDESWGILAGAYTASRASTEDQAYSALLLNSLRQSQQRGDDAGRTLADALMAGWRPALAAARGTGALAALRERALAVTIASQTTASDFAFITALTGVQSFGNIEPSVYGSGQAFDATYTGFVSNQASIDLALGWYLQAQSASGRSFDSSLLNRLSDQAQSEVSTFATVRNSADAFIGGFGQDAVSFARGSETPEAVLNALSGGWENRFWLATLAAQGVDPASLAAQVLAWRQSRLVTLLPDVNAALAAAVTQAADSAAAAEIAVAFRQSAQAWQTRIADDPEGFRGYLAELRDSDGEAIEPALEWNENGGNRNIQARYELAQAAAAFGEATGESGGTEVLRDFVDRYSRFTQGASDWTDGDTYHVPDAVRNAFDLSSEELNKTLDRMGGDQAQIVQLGKIRERIVDPATDAETDALAADIQNSLGAYTAAQNSLDATMQSLVDSMADYNQDYQVSNAAYRAAEEARYAFEAQDQILTYSKNGYLSAADPTLQLAGYQSPAQLLATATAMKTRVQTVLDTLTSVTPSAANANSQVNAVDAAYRTTTGELLSLTALQDQLAAQIARQDVIARSYGQTYQDSSSKIVRLSPGLLKDKDTLWAQYLVADPAKGLALNFDPTTFVLGTRDTTSETDAWTAYTADRDTYDEFDSGSLAYNLEHWEASMQSWSKADANGYQSTLKTWGLAYDYLLFKIKSKNPGTTDLDKLLEASGTKDLNLDDDTSLDEFLLASGNSDLMRDIQGKSGNNNYTYLKSYRNWIRGQLMAAWNTVKADKTHWQLFQNALAFRLAGALVNKNYFDYSSSQKAFQYIRDQAQDKADGRFGSAGVFAGIAVGFAATFNFGAAAVFGALALDERQKGIQQQNAADAAKKVYNGRQSLIVEALAVGELNSEAVAWTNYSNSWNILQTLKGSKTGATIITPATLKLSLSTAMTQRHTTLSAADQATIDRQFALLSDADKTDSVTALAAIVRLSQNQQRNSQQDLSSRFASLQTQFAADETAYRSLEAKYLAGDASVTLAQLKAQAQATYGSPVYTALVQAQKQMAEDTTAIADATTPLTGKENRKTLLAGRIVSTISQLEALRPAHLKQVRLNEWAVRQQELDTQHQRWQNQITATVVKSQQAWADSFNKLNTGYQSWQTSFAQEYRDKAEAWSEVYQGFQWDRRQWVDAVATNADQAQNQVWAISAGQAADAAISRRAMSIIGDIGAGMVSADGIVGQILGSSSLDSYLKGAQRINGSLAAVSTSLRQGLKYDVGTINSLAAIQAIQNERNDDLSQHAALIVAAQARDNLAQAQEAYSGQVEGANDSVDAQMDQTFLGSGYGKTGGRYTRRAIIGSTLMGNLYETQSVDTYKPFKDYDFSVQTTLDDASLTGLDASAVQARVDLAMTELKDKAEAIFGPSDEEEKKKTDKVFEFVINGGDGKTDISKVNQEIQAFRDKDASGKKTDGRTVVKTVSAGTFNTYMGNTPEMKSDPDLETDNLEAGFKSSVLIPGTGETGRLIGWYQYFGMRASKGWAEQDQPFYSQKLYDDRHSWIKSPTLKDVAMTGVGIAATLATGGVAGGLIGALETAAMTTGADALFTMADVAHGADAAQSWGNFGVRGVSSFAISALGAVGGSIMGQGAVYAANGTLKTAATGFMAMQGAGGVLARGGLLIAQGLTTKAVSSSISAIHFGPGGSISYDSEGLANQWSLSDSGGHFSMANYASSLSGAAQSVTTGLLGEWDMTDGLDHALTGNVFNVNGIQAFNGLAGSAVSAGLSYGMTGEAAFNVGGLDISNQHFGLMELHVGGNGTSMNLGTGGVDVNARQILAGLGGASDALRVSAIKGAALLGDKQDVNMLNSINMLGTMPNRPLAGTNASTRQLASDLWDGHVGSSFVAMVGMDTGARGYVNKADPTKMYLNKDNVGTDAQSTAQLVSLLAHEGTHLYGDVFSADDEKNAYFNGLMTYKDAAQLYGVEADNSFIAEQLGALMDPSTMDMGNPDHAYWKVIKGADGRLAGVIDDKDYDHVTLVDGNGAKLEVKDRSGPLSQQVAEMLGNGMTKQQVNDAMAQKYGLDWNGKSWYVKDAEKQQALIDTNHISDAAGTFGKSWADSVLDWGKSAWSTIGNWFKGSQKTVPDSQSSISYPETVIKQKLLQDAYGYPDTLCLAADFINAYRVVNGLPDSQVNSVMLTAKGKYLDTQGKVLDAPAWSKALAQASGSTTYFDYVYNEGAMQVLSADEFQTSDYILGIGAYTQPGGNPTKIVHWELVQKRPWMEYNPGRSNYVLYNIRPLQSLKY